MFTVKFDVLRHFYKFSKFMVVGRTLRPTINVWNILRRNKTHYKLVVGKAKYVILEQIVC